MLYFYCYCCCCYLYFPLIFLFFFTFLATSAAQKVQYATPPHLSGILFLFLQQQRQQQKLKEKKNEKLPTITTEAFQLNLSLLSFFMTPLLLSCTTRSNNNNNGNTKNLSQQLLLQIPPTQLYLNLQLSSFLKFQQQKVYIFFPFFGHNFIFCLFLSHFGLAPFNYR